MLQIPHEKRLPYLRQRIKELNFEFPQAEISKRMDYNKGNLSQILKGNSKRSVPKEFFENFIKTFGELVAPFEVGDYSNEILEEPINNLYANIDENNKKDTTSLTNLNMDDFRNLHKQVNAILDINKGLTETLNKNADAAIINARAKEHDSISINTISNTNKEMWDMIKNQPNLASSDVHDQIPLPVVVVVNRMIEVIAAKFGGEKAQDLTGEIYRYVYENPKEHEPAGNKQNASTVGKG